MISKNTLPGTHVVAVVTMAMFDVLIVEGRTYVVHDIVASSPYRYGVRLVGVNDRSTSPVFIDLWELDYAVLPDSTLRLTRSAPVSEMA